MKKGIILYGIPGWAIFLFPQIAFPLLLLYFLATVLAARVLLFFHQREISWRKLVFYSFPTPFVVWLTVITGEIINFEILAARYTHFYCFIPLSLVSVFGLNYILSKHHLGLAGRAAWLFAALLAVLVTVFSYLALTGFVWLLAYLAR